MLPSLQNTLASRPPVPRSPADARRWVETARRRRLLYNRHYPDVWHRVVASVGPERAKAWLPLDMSSNPFEQVWRLLSGLYRGEPTWAGPHPDVITAVAESGYWSMMQTVQRDTLGLGEMAVLCDLDDEGQPLAHCIFPDLMTVKVKPRQPRQLQRVEWWEQDPGDESKWVRWVVDPGNREYSAWDAKGNDITAKLRGGATEYPWVDRKGNALQPVVLYHREITGYTWDPYSYATVVEGSLQLGVLYSSYNHAVEQASWMQRYVLGAAPRVGEVSEDGAAHQVVADPATVLSLEADESSMTQPIVGQWASPVDLEKLIQSIRIYEQRLVEQAAGGVEVTRQSADIRSGYSLAVGREERLAQQRRYAPQFRWADRQAMRIWSALLGASRGKNYPTVWAPRQGPARTDPADCEYDLPALDAGNTNPGDEQ